MTNTTTTPAFRHLRGLPPVTPVLPTKGRRAIHVALTSVVKNRSIMQVSGPNGSGKTSSIHYELQKYAERHGTRWAEVGVTHNPNGKVLLQTISQKLGCTVDERMTKETMRQLVSHALRDEQWILWLDEVEHATKDALREVRHLFDDHLVSSCLVMSGNQDLPSSLNRHEKGLASRVARKVTFTAIEDDEAPELMSDYDPIYAATPAKILIEINRRAKGSFRTWAHLTDCVHDYAPALDPVPTSFTRALRGPVFSLMGWR